MLIHSGTKQLAFFGISHWIIHSIDLLKKIDLFRNKTSGSLYELVNHSFNQFTLKHWSFSNKKVCLYKWAIESLIQPISSKSLILSDSFIHSCECDIALISLVIWYDLTAVTQWLGFFWVCLYPEKICCLV